VPAFGAWKHQYLIILCKHAMTGPMHVLQGVALPSKGAAEGWKEQPHNRD
jgi:hypothetical protein